MPTVSRKLADHVELLSANTSVTVDIDNNWDLSKTFLVFTHTSPTNLDNYERSVVSGKLYESGGTKYVKFERGESGTQFWIDYQIIQINEAYVQHGQCSLPDASNTAAIVSIDTTKTFIIATARTNVSNAAAEDFCFLAEVTDATTITFTRNDTTGELTIEYQVITIPEIKSLQVKTGNITSAGSNVTNISITSVDMTKTITFTYFKTSAATFTGRHFREGHITSATNLRFESFTNIASGSIDYLIYVIEFQVSNVYMNYDTITAVNLQTDVSIGATVNLDKTLFKLNGIMGVWLEVESSVKNSGDSITTAWTFTTTQFTVSKGKSGLLTAFAWEIIEFVPLPIADHNVMRGCARGVMRGVS
jgi:hypothetical protein